MAKLHRYDTPEQVSSTVGRMAQLVYVPHRDLIEVVFEIGDDSGDSFDVHDREVVSVSLSALSGELQTTFAGLETQALAFAETQGIFPSGTEEEDV